MKTFLFAATLCCVVAVGQEAIPPDYGQPPTPVIVARIQQALKAGDLQQAEALAEQYRRLNGYTPDALLALGWAARGELAARRVDQASQMAAEILQNGQLALSTRPIDAEPYLPLALGTAYEVQAEVLFAKGQRAAALQLLQKAALKWRNTSLDDRLEKNINLLTLRGRPMPFIRETEWLGAKKPASPAALRGKVVLLFFWAHWCSDCKAEAPVLAKLGTELKTRGFVILAPTRRYGYTSEFEHAPPAVETPFIHKVFDHYYASIPTDGVPVDRGNFQRYGVSTTPTLVLVDRRGIVRMYHPGLMSEEDLRGAIEALLRAS
jgi:thiol-disulfide isomerase/thioredoxin